MTEYDVNPGSGEALNEGCSCPTLDNNHGRGYYGDSDEFVVDASCPVHGDGDDVSMVFEP